MVDLTIAPIGLGGHRLEEACAAYGRLQSVTPGLADDERNPGVGIGTKDQVRVVDSNEFQEVGDYLLSLALPVSFCGR